MTPVPKNLSPQQVLAWRRAIARGTPTARAGVLAAQGGAKYKDGSAATSLSRTERGVS